MIETVSATNNDIVIAPYEEWMNSQVILMFSEFYGTSTEEVLSVHKKFFNHTFQKGKVIRIAALAGREVIGFTSFAYWPYNKNGVLYNSYQVGNAMIHPAYRGKRIFPMLLKYVDENYQKLGVDFLFAFPHISASYPSFMRSGYNNPFDLVWGVKIFNPFAFLVTPENILKKFSSSPDVIQENADKNYRLGRTYDFDDWFLGSRSVNNYAFYNFTDKNNRITFYLKSYRRGRWLNELIIGDIRMENFDAEALKEAFNSFFSIVRKSLAVSMVSIAYNEHLSNFKIPVIKMNFRKIKPVIHFVYRNYLQENLLSNPCEWELYRGDLDTW